MINKDELHQMELQVPDYEFVEPEPDAQPVSPIRRQIAKIQQTASLFNMYDVYKAIGGIEKIIEGKKAEIEAHEKQKELFLAEIALIEKALGVNDLERQFHVDVATEIAVEEAMKNPQVAPAKTDSEGNEG